MDINSVIQEKGLEKELDDLLINPPGLKIKKKIGSGGFATVHK